MSSERDARDRLERSFARPVRGLGDRIATALSAAIGIRPVQTVPDAGSGRHRVHGERSVLVVGGGLAGMSAAIRLANRGFRVRLVEREHHLGGKVGAWPIRLGGEEVVVEHGFHGFFLQYYNLYRLFDEVGIDVADFPLVDDYAITASDGRSEGMRAYPRTPPWNVLSMARHSPFLNMTEARRMTGFATMRDAFVLFEPREARERYDGMSFAELSRRMGLTDTGFDAVFKVFGHSFFSDSATVSASEIIKNFHFFFFANPEGLLFRYCRKDFEAALWTPLRRHLEWLGGTIETGCEVLSLDARDDGFAVAVREPGGALATRAAGRLVLAADVPALKRIVAGSAHLAARDERFASFARTVDAIAGPQPYAVLRLWGDRDCLPERAAFTSLFGYEPLDSISVYHRMEDGSRDWVARHGGGIFELHAYTPPSDDARDPERMGALLIERMRRAFPELREMAIRHSYRQVKWDFPGFPVGSGPCQPETTTAMPGLYLAGDFVRMDAPVALMEGAVASGIAAANAIFTEEQLARDPIWSVPVRGVLRDAWPTRVRVARALAVSRPLFWLNSATLCVLAVVLSGRLPALRELLLIAFATFPLNLLVYALNDLHDLESDRLNPRKGSAEGARASSGALRTLQRAAVWLNAPFVGYFALTTQRASALVALAATYFIAWAYSAPPLRAKSRPGWDSLANAGYVLPFVFACLYLGVPDPPWRETVAFAVWAIGAHAFTSIQDADADRAAGVRTIATALGAPASALVAIGAYLLAFQLVVDQHPAYASLLLLHVLLVVWMRRTTRPDAAHAAYRAFMALNLAAGFVITVAVALAHPATTRWTALVMLSLCALV
ncbi:FAD-dependent oxidoreductase, partial [Candidatus Binatia bacterium]|nr:FAD-dependent oxidoreductase [Candidatus Binatia bacterium]